MNQVTRITKVFAFIHSFKPLLSENISLKYFS